MFRFTCFPFVAKCRKKLFDITDIKPLYDNYHFVFISGNHNQSLFMDYLISIFVKKIIIFIKTIRNSLF